MKPEDFAKDCKSAGINNTGDGLLLGFIARGLYSAAIGEAEAAIAKRQREIHFLNELKDALRGALQ